MRKKELRVIVSFSTTTQAIAMEEAAVSEGLEGRLIPIPLQITADCGLAWSEKHLEYDRMTELVI